MSDERRELKELFANREMSDRHPSNYALDREDEMQDTTIYNNGTTTQSQGGNTKKVEEPEFNQ